VEFIIEYFETIPSWHRTLILAGGIAIFWILESAFPIINFKYKKWSHSLPNFFFTLTTLVINLAFAVVIVMTSDWAQLTQFGLFHMIADLPLWLVTVLCLMTMDLVGAWLVHWTEHQVHWMWKFHIIHHTDEHVDTTTALRHHPGESVFRAVFTFVAVLVVGAPIWLVMIYQSLSALFSQFNHANLGLPASVDKAISFLFVTPGMHRIHHHHVQPYTDKNYGNIFSLWDRLLGTYAWLPKEKVVFGLDVYDKETQSLKDLLLTPVDGKSYSTKEKYNHKR